MAIVVQVSLPNNKGGAAGSEKFAAVGNGGKMAYSAAG